MVWELVSGIWMDVWKAYHLGMLSGGRRKGVVLCGDVVAMVLRDVCLSIPDVCMMVGVCRDDCRAIDLIVVCIDDVASPRTELRR